MNYEETINVNDLIFRVCLCLERHIAFPCGVDAAET
jgi:hypothetical protein